jgi:hypothetical protein
MIQIKKEKDKIILSITTTIQRGNSITIDSEIDREDVRDIVDDLNQWLEDTVEVPKFKGISEEKVREALRYDNQNAGPSDLKFHNKAHEEAYQQAQSKLKLERDLKRYFVDVFDSEYIQKELTSYQLDPINKEVITKTKKLKDERRK